MDPTSFRQAGALEALVFAMRGALPGRFRVLRRAATALGLVGAVDRSVEVWRIAQMRRVVVCRNGCIHEPCEPCERLLCCMLQLVRQMACGGLTV